MIPSPACYDLIKKWEGILDGDPSTVNIDPYLCPANVATIGWGHAVIEHGKQLRGAKGLKRARELYPHGITMEQAQTLLEADVLERSPYVDWMIDVQVTQGQFDALVSFAFNLGNGALRRSTLLRKLNAFDIEGAAEEFGRWVYAGGRKLAGLVNRRAEEREMFTA